MDEQLQIFLLTRNTNNPSSQRTITILITFLIITLYITYLTFYYSIKTKQGSDKKYSIISSNSSNFPSDIFNTEKTLRKNIESSEIAEFYEGFLNEKQKKSITSKLLKYY